MSDPDKFQQRSEKEIFFEALDKHTPEERAAFLDGACGRDPVRRARVEALLADHFQTDAFMKQPAAEAARPTIKLDFAAGPDEAPGQMIGRYKLLEKVGEGGCGVVYVAEQTEPVRRRVALKVIKLGMDTKTVVARFEAERQALAMMDHPNIAKVFDAGTTEKGRPYFVMELVRGIRITDYCDQNQLTAKQRLDLFIKVCQAIQHAHQKGIIHRDIKPSNILVALHDGVPVPKVIDFGIAKATEGRLTDATVYTQLNQFIGTPAYMSPEQAEMSGLDIDTRSDIYSLGVLLYELLTGRPPFDPSELMAAGIDAMRRTIRQKEPMRPSTRLTQELQLAEATPRRAGEGLAIPTQDEVNAEARRRLRLKEQIARIRGDLDWIVMRCLEKDRTRRYETANGLAADLKRHLDNEPVVACPPSASYRFQKAFRRNKMVFVAGTAVVTALVLGVIGTTMGMLRAEKQRKAAESSRNLAEQRFLSARRFVDDVFQNVLPGFSDLVGASKATEALARTSVTFLESLGDGRGSDEAFQIELAGLYLQFANALGGPFAANSLGDYNAALRFANQALTIEQAVQRKHPKDRARLKSLTRAEGAVGDILAVLDRVDEALPHHRRCLELVLQEFDLNPDDVSVRNIMIANIKIGNDLRAQGLTREALEHYLMPSTKDWLNRQLDPGLSSAELHWIGVANQSVGLSQLELGQPAEALLHFKQALRAAELQIEQEPNNARNARDWSNSQGCVGGALVALGRFEEGTKFLQEGVRAAEGLAGRDPMNGSFQSHLIKTLHWQAEGYAKFARSAEISLARQAELWRQAIQVLTRCEERLASRELDRVRPLLTKEAKGITRDLNEARDALAKIPVAPASTKPSAL